MSFKYSDETDFSMNDFSDTEIKTEKNNKKRSGSLKSKPNKKKTLQSYLTLLEKDSKNQGINEKNVIKIKKPTGGSYKIQIPSIIGDQLFVVQAYKISEMEEVPVKERWKTCNFSLRTVANSNSKKDEPLVNAINAIIDHSMTRFMNDPNKSVDSFN